MIAEYLRFHQEIRLLPIWELNKLVHKMSNRP